KVLHDEDMAAAILDRVLERGRFIHLDGPSGRTRHLNLEEVLPGGRDRARISGIDLPEFPEPTRIFPGPISHLRYSPRRKAKSPALPGQTLRLIRPLLLSSLSRARGRLRQALTGL